LIQAPAAQMTVYTTRTTPKPRPPEKPAAQTPRKPSATTGPNVSVLGGVTWDRKTRPTTTLASHSEKPAEPVPPVEAPAPAVEHPTPAIEPESEPAVAAQQ
jgi:hypothetical protein